jgi:hypothetical protein
MTQTTGGMNFKRCDAGLGTTASTTDWGPYGVSIAVSGGERASAAQHTRDGDTPIVSVGKRGPITITVRYVYTPTAANFDAIALAIYETEDPACYFTWSPESDDVGSYPKFYTSGGKLTSYKYPQGDVGEAGTILGEIQIVCKEIVDGTVA